MSRHTEVDHLTPEAATELDRTCVRMLGQVVTPPARQELRPLAQALASGARATGMLPERMVMEVRARWRVAFRTSEYATRERGETVLGELLSLCIDEYFADGQPVRRAAPPRASRAALSATPGAAAEVAPLMR